MQIFVARCRRCEKFRTFGFIDLWFFGLSDFYKIGFLDLSTCGYLDTRNCISVYRRCQGWIILPSTYIYIYMYAHMHHIYIYIYVHEHTRLAKPGFSSGGRVSCKPNNGALLSTSGNKNDDSKNPNYCALLGTRTNINNDSKSDSKSIGAGMDILRLVSP